MQDRHLLDVKLGRVIEYTRDDRNEIRKLAGDLVLACEYSRPELARLTLAIYKVTQRAIRRSHAS